MSKHNDFASIGNVYGQMLNGVRHKLVSEGKLGPKVKPGEIGESPLLDGGPQEKGGFSKNVIDRRTKGKKENMYNIDKLSQSDCGCDYEEDEETKKEKNKNPKKHLKKHKKGSEEDKETVKIAKESINTFMRKKSIFDKLYENVMGDNAGGLPTGGPGGSGMLGGDSGESDDLDALGIEGEGEGEDEGDEVTLTLDKATAQALLDVLQAAVGSSEEVEGEDEGLDDEGEDMGDGSEDMDEESEEGWGDEDEEDVASAKNLGTQVDYGKNNKVGNLKVQSGGAKSDYTHKVGPDGDHGHAIHNGKQPNMGKSNKVGSLKHGKSMFEQ